MTPRPRGGPHDWVRQTSQSFEITILESFFEWIDEMKRSPTPTPENDDEYENIEINYEAERQAR
jgi:hypothetical protein